MDWPMLLVGLSSIAFGVLGPMDRLVNPRDERDRRAKGLLVSFAVASIGGGAVLAAYAVVA
jgi:hypothetical protein